MSNFRPPGNSTKRPPSKVADFAGLFGQRQVVIYKTNERGWDISNAFANEIYDLNLSVQGLATLRAGKRKINDTGYAASVTAIFPLQIGGKDRYGVVQDGRLEVVDMPTYEGTVREPVELDPPTARFRTWNEVRQEWTFDTLKTQKTWIGLLAEEIVEYPLADPSEWAP